MFGPRGRNPLKLKGQDKFRLSCTSDYEKARMLLVDALEILKVNSVHRKLAHPPTVTSGRVRP
jgi:hypothetical protein